MSSLSRCVVNLLNSVCGSNNKPNCFSLRNKRTEEKKRIGKKLIEQKKWKRFRGVFFSFERWLLNQVLCTKWINQNNFIFTMTYIFCFFSLSIFFSPKIMQKTTKAGVIFILMFWMRFTLYMLLAGSGLTWKLNYRTNTDNAAIIFGFEFLFQLEFTLSHLVV